MNRIGGALDYRQLAQVHKPADPSTEIRSLHAQGLKPRDIASHLGLHIDIVLRAIKAGAA